MSYMISRVCAKTLLKKLLGGCTTLIQQEGMALTMFHAGCWVYFRIQGVA
jgi:hypothetical protein